jgi:hypothetical protein
MGALGVVALLVTQGAVPSVSGWVELDDDVSDRYALVEARISLDGREIAHREAPEGGELSGPLRLEWVIAPGEHELVAELVYRGRNRGPFTYLDNFRYRVRAPLFFVSGRGEGPASVRVVARERRGAEVRLDERFELSFEPPPGSSVDRPAARPVPLPPGR